jgi:SAM-dependent MidA family methyltransferase
MKEFFSANQGLVRFDAFMQKALYDPASGYYSQGDRVFGVQGDFVTAPEISPLFGKTLAHAIRGPLVACGGHIWEFGAGRGLLARDLMLALGDAITGYHIIDLSGALQAQQRSTLLAAGIDVNNRVSWETRLPDSLRGVVIGNEVLDAMPVRVFRVSNTCIYERFVRLAPDAGLDWQDEIASGDLQHRVNWLQSRHGPWPSDYISEWPEQAFGFVRTITRLLQGVAVMIDYGFGASEFYHPQRCTGTLVAHHLHQMSADVLQRVGEQDLTAHVDFTGVYDALSDEGADLLGYTSQAAFLLHHGLLDNAVQGAVTGIEQAQQRHAIQTLVNPSEMGELFKVMVWSRGVNPDTWPLTHTLAGIDRSRQL